MSKINPNCQYQGYEFGAGYLDSVCINGQLFDADNCDGDGNFYEPSDWIPCPICLRDYAIKWHAEQMGGNPKTCRRSAKRLVKNIRIHCNVKTGKRLFDYAGCEL